AGGAPAAELRTAAADLSHIQGQLLGPNAAAGHPFLPRRASGRRAFLVRSGAALSGAALVGPLLPSCARPRPICRTSRANCWGPTPPPAT
ncbi:hypothetical protein, partial [Hymenobacter coccineus]|uniref:hypothetical protein n=1 Tax=Hymenobacter coccineus TaxID=1908235 RepID=UPI0013016E94